MLLPLQPLLPPLQVTVLDANTGQPLDFATVRTSKGGAYTDGDGIAKVTIQRGNVDSLWVSYIGYVSAVRMISSQPLTVKLEPSFSVIEDIVIEDRSQLPVSPAGKGEAVTVNPQKMQPLSFLGEADLFRTLQWAPGISGANESAAGLEIRGGTADQNLVLLDGMEIYNSGHFSGMLNAFNAQALNRARTIRGGFGAEYGGRISGVIDLSGVPESPDSFHVGASVNFLNVNGFVQVPIIKKRMTLFVAGRRSYNEIYSSPFYESMADNLFQSSESSQDTTETDDEEDVGIDVDPIATFYDVHAKLLLRPSDKDVLTFTWYQGGDVIDYSFTESDNFGYFRSNIDELRPQNIGGSLNWSHQWPKNINTYSSASYSSFTSRYENSQTLIEEAEDTFAIRLEQVSKVSTLKGVVGMNWFINGKHQFESGIQANYHETPVAITTIEEGEEPEGDSLDPTGLLATAFGQHTYKPIETLTLRGGIRASYFGPQNQPFFEPRVAALFEPVEGLAVKASWGQYFQFLNSVRQDNQLKLGETFFILANEDDEIEVMDSRHSIVGVSYQKPGFWAEAEFYHKSLYGIQTYTNRFDASLNANQSQELLKEGGGTVLGMDLFLRKQWGPYTGWVSYSLSQAKYSFDSIDDGMSFPADQDRRHEVKLVNIVDAGPCQFTLTWIFASGRPYTPAVGIDSVSNEGDIELIFAANNSRRLPAYHRMDFSFLYPFSIGKKGRASTGVTIFNLYNRENIRDRNYSIQPSETNEEEFEVVAINRELLRISPNVFFTIRF